MRTVTNSPSINHEFKLSHPFTMLASGGSGMGKVSQYTSNFSSRFRLHLSNEQLQKTSFPFDHEKLYAVILVN